MQSPNNPLIVAIDTPDLKRAAELCGALRGHVGAVKLGLEFFSAHGANGVRDVLPPDMPLFLDLKFHDIPNTVEKAIRALHGLPVWLLTVHASGGTAMMQAAARGADWLAGQGQARPNVLGVTVLTSMDEADMEQIGVQLDVARQVQKLALLAQRSGLDGVVCSPQEIKILRSAFKNSTQIEWDMPEAIPLLNSSGTLEQPSFNPANKRGGDKQGKEMLLVTPGIRPAGSAAGDQKRTLTPKEALAHGANYLVVGRPITEASDPAGAAQQMLLS